MAEILTFSRANPVQRAIRRVAATAPGSWLAARVLHRLDRPVFRISRGRHTLSSLVTGLPVVMLTTTGARSGLSRTVPVLGFPSAEGLVVIASNYGQVHHPAWYHNLRASPQGSVCVNGATRAFRAVEAEGDRRQRIWQEGLTIYPGFSTYERRAADRRIAVFVLEPTG